MLVYFTQLYKYSKLLAAKHSFQTVVSDEKKNQTEFQAKEMIRFSESR